MAHLDEDIKRDVINQLRWDNRVDESNIRVDVKNGIVNLEGTVSSYAEQKAVDNDMWARPGIISYNNKLTVQYPTSVRIPTDDEIKHNVREVISWNPNLDLTRMNISVKNGLVTIEGSIDSLWKKYAVEDLVSDVGGIAGITNKLVVVPTQDIVDKKIAQSIVSTLDRNATVDVDSVNVTVDHGTVTLSGTVPNWAAFRAAREAVLYTAGAVDIKNNLSVA
ncbi:MAG: BON domain-containing protein [bacterium]